MIVKVVLGCGLPGIHNRILECVHIHLQAKDNYTEMICHSAPSAENIDPYTIHLGSETEDHVYIMDKGKTVDHMTFYPAEKIPEPIENQDK